jgi:hypothetical protein
MPFSLRKLIIAVLACGTAGSLQAQPPWTGQTFLPDYSKLKAIPTKNGQDYAYLDQSFDPKSINGQVMIDQPEVLISPASPYGGAKPDDLKAIAEFVRGRVGAQLTARGYQIVDAKGDGVIYLRIGITDLKLKNKRTPILAYTPVGFVLHTAVKAMEAFLQKMDITNVELQGEWLDASSGRQVAEGVATRGESAGSGKKMSYHDFEATIDDLAARFACRMDNGRVPQEQRIDCSDARAREARAPIPLH